MKHEDVEVDVSLVNVADVKVENGEPGPNCGQLLLHTSPEAQNKDEEGTESLRSDSSKTADPEPMRRHGDHEDAAVPSDSNCKSKLTRTHTGKKAFSCSTCRKEFSKSSILIDHMKIHTGERPYLCNTFNKPFTKSSALKSHIITHMGEKPYIFKTCGKSYRERSKLVIHSRIHTSEKPYICKTCGKSYRLRSTLVVHSRTHTGESPSLCNTCGKTFTKSSHLNRHITTHTDELIGVEYLYKQTGKVLQDYNVAIEQSENNVVQVDESFIETEEFVNMTLPSLETVRRPAVSQSSAAAPIPPLSAPPSTSSTCLPAVPPSAPSTSSMSLPAVPPSATASPLDSLLMAKSRPAILPATQCSPTQQPSSGAAAQASEASSSHDDSVGPDNIEGYGAVQDLAEFLVGLRHHRLALSGEEANQVITLWQMLGEYDKSKTIYPKRHRTNLEQGRFRATKKIVAPGVESTKRSFIGAHSPAQWPDCNRVVEASS
ncbi:zinc finger protein 79-like [Cololabis saira]|uniref:zinc finger protein 79-like n=1 Tax=Cololabis saira TaxID=129043 RepID=UPI002AD22FC2|nr:zinc finger protein 79-like [Cololabis saira]